MPKEPNSNLASPTPGQLENTPHRPQATDQSPHTSTPTGLRGKRGWTDGMIEDLLGDTDRKVRNQHHRTGPRVGLYDMERVI